MQLSTMDTIISVIGIILTLANGWLVLVVKSFQADIRNLRKADDELQRQVGAVQLLVAGSYITKDEMRAALRDQTETLLRRMDDVFRPFRDRSERERRP